MRSENRKLLIIKPPYAHIPVGIAYVLSCLERNGIPFDFIDTLLTKPNYTKLLRKNNYLAFATGGLIANFNFIAQAIKIIRSIKPDLPIIVCGNIIKDTNPNFLFDKGIMGIDFGIMGEAETSLPYLIDKLKNDCNDFSDVPGLLFKERNGTVIKNQPQRLNLESANILPAWHKINVNYYKYARVSYMANQKVLPVLTGRGCVGSCTFCSPTVGIFRKRPIEHVIEEIEFLFSKYDFDILNILNEMFYQDQEDILRFCKEYKKLKTRKPWMCGMRVDVKGIDDDTFAAMKEAGCILAGIGIESGSNKVLEIMKKRITKDRTISFCKSAKKAKLPTLGTFMIGNEGENEEDIKETIDMVINEEMNTDASLTDPYPGTQIYQNALKKGLIRDEKEYYKDIYFTPGIYNIPSAINRNRYLNISEISDEHFWKVIFTECRRFYAFSFKRFKILKVKHKINWLTNTIKATGICSECGSHVKISSLFNLLGQVVYCPKCYRGLYLDYRKLEGFSGHFEILGEELKRGEKLVIVGAQLQAMNILRYDHFNLDYEKIKGFLRLEESQNSDLLFGYFPLLQMKDLASIIPDTILIADDPHGNAELKLKVFYAKNKLVLPKILHLNGNKKILWRLFVLKSLLKRIFGISFMQKIGLFCLKHELR